MKICALVAEYNPLHYGHLKLLDYARKELGADKIIAILSGNFCERGEAAVLDKYTRARHAVMAGADLVIELPAVFATANAEIFATGAVSLLKSARIADTLCFGVESGDAEAYLAAARAMNDESKEFKHALKKELDTGVSFAKARFNAVKAVALPELDESLVSSPNNVLALEYTKAILKLGAKTAIAPYLREGDHNDPKLKKGVTSAHSIRLAIDSGNKKKVKKCVPPYVYADLPERLPDFKKYILAALTSATAKEIAAAPDCSEGLENRIKALLKDNLSYDDLVERVSTKRYTLARVRRIMLSAFLRINADLVARCLKSPLYLKALAVRADATDLIAELRKRSDAPVIMRKSDCRALEKTALECFEKDVTAGDLYDLVTGVKRNEYFTEII